MPTRTTMAAARAFLICLLALAVFGFLAPAAEHTNVVQSVVSAHDHHGHSHGDEKQTSAPSSHDNDRFHAGDHSHDTPSATVLNGLRFALLKESGPGTPDARKASRPNPPGDRPPWTA